MPSSAGVLSISELINIYNSGKGNTAYLVDVVRVLESIASRDASEDATIEDIRTEISTLSAAILVNTKEIQHLHSLLALLIFELLDQGIPIENKQLLEELKLYLKQR